MTQRPLGGAGPAPAVPAPPSGAGRGAGGSPDVVPAAARVEVDRIRRRWSELAVGTAEASAPAVRTVVEALASRTAPGAVVPDLGPGVLPDQLAVVVWDAYAANLGDGVADTLSALRRALP